MQKRLFLTPLAIIVFILYFTVFGDRGLLRINHLHRDRDDMQKRLAELKDENDRLKREIAALQSDRRYLESIARRDFGLVRGNEVIYQFPSKDGTDHPIAKQPAGTAPQAAPAAGGKAPGKAAAPAKADPAKSN
ncbi:septum formation initiator family protein [Geomonas sp. Red32]|uniref:FtsB family cell division protein n=1 Tax=Geomonas sp. Red32 TaxID=2912856 RepID=UPI00202CD7D6|nr:septum formation initiator family protein [Geomonas sp. Red32]MCM0083232.1 septum formation initiator family protein [Geomonas sp. Red32]